MARVAMRLGLRMRIEDAAGADIARAAVAHLAVTIPERYLLGTFAHPAQISLGKTSSHAADGRLVAGDEPGLGFEPGDAIGLPVARYS